MVACIIKIGRTSSRSFEIFRFSTDLKGSERTDDFLFVGFKESREVQENGLVRFIICFDDWFKEDSISSSGLYEAVLKEIYISFSLCKVLRRGLILKNITSI